MKSFILLDFCRNLEAGDVIISFNWDCLVELTLQELNLSYSYDWREGADKSCIPIIKLHGSINWHHGKWPEIDCHRKKESALYWESFLDDFSNQSASLAFCKELVSPNKWENYNNWDFINPLVIMPGYGKAGDLRKIAPLWYISSKYFNRAEKAFVIGLGLNPDDVFVKSFLSENLRNTNISVFNINPDPKIHERFSFIDPMRYRKICESFDAKHIQSMPQNS